MHVLPVMTTMSPVAKSFAADVVTVAVSAPEPTEGLVIVEIVAESVLAEPCVAK